MDNISITNLVLTSFVLISSRTISDNADAGDWTLEIPSYWCGVDMCATIATAFASQYWYVIVSFAIVQGYLTYKTVKLARCTYVSLGLENGHHQ